MFYNDAKNEAIERAKQSEAAFNEEVNQARELALNLYSRRKTAAQAIYRVERYINALANSPKEFRRDIARIIVELREFREAVNLEEESNSANLKGAGMAIGGVAMGGAVAALGPTAAMAVATTFGVASTGTAISALTGAAATNAALAWLGGGAIVAGGSGMAAGNALIAFMTGPLGWIIAGTLAVGGGAFASYQNSELAEKANKYASDIRTKLSVLKPKVKELRNLYVETGNLTSAIAVTPFNSYPDNYLNFNKAQKDNLATLVNNTISLGRLINKHIEITA